MSIEIKVPRFPESVSDATLVNWCRAPGDEVRRDEKLVELETDKVVLEVPSPDDGVLREIRVASGATVTTGQVLAVLEPTVVSEHSPAAVDDAPAADAPPVPAADEAAIAGSASDAGEAAAAGGAPVHDLLPGETVERAGPSVRRLMREHGVDASAVRGTGRGGRITKSDVLDYIGKGSHTIAGLEYDVPVSAAPAAPDGYRHQRRVPMTRLRARIAERLVEAQRTSALLTTFNEVDMSTVIAARTRYGEAFQRKHEVKLGFMSFFIKASVEALGRFPVLNASVDGSDIIYHEYFDIGVAVSTDRGLIVPILRNAEEKGFAEIEKTIVEFGARARSGDLGIEELTGGTFTITNGGIFGSLMSTPIINPPQSGILGMHTIQQRPVVVDGEIAVRPMMYLALTYDHRIVDGREAVQFLVALKELLEDPARLLLQV